MGAKPKYSKEIKIKACKDYEKGNISFANVAKMIGSSKEVVRRWYLIYKEHGIGGFDRPKGERLYSWEFKSQVIKDSISGNYSETDIAVKYNISTTLISSWVKKCYNGIEIKDCYTKGDVHNMKPRKTTFEERLEITKWVVSNNMDYKGAAEKYSVSYARVYKWTGTYLNEGKEALKAKKRGPKRKSKSDKSNLTEVEKLKLELSKEKALRKKKEFEIEVLKKKEEFEKDLYFQKSDKNQNTKQ